MKSRRTLVLIVALCLAAWPLTQQAAMSQDGADGEPPPAPVSDDEIGVALQLQDSFAIVAERVLPSTVAVTAYVRKAEAESDEGEGGPRSEWVKQLNADYPGFEPFNAGSGMVMSADGYVITARHVVLRQDGEAADLIDVEIEGGRHVIARLVGAEPTLNLAVLKALHFDEKKAPKYTPVVLGDSTAIEVGHWAIGLGDPAGPVRFFDAGVLAAKPNRDCYQEQLTATYLQAALKVHPQCYGGPLVNIRGQVIGMLTPRLPQLGVLADPTNEGLEFALPSNIIKTIYAALLEKESVQSPWLGYAVASPAELRKTIGPEAFRTMKRPPLGIYIENVFDPSPAHAAGIKPGDFLVKFDGKFVRSPLEFQRHLYLAGIGARVKLTMFREGETYEVEIPIELRPLNAAFK